MQTINKKREAISHQRSLISLLLGLHYFVSDYTGLNLNVLAFKRFSKVF